MNYYVELTELEKRVVLMCLGQFSSPDDRDWLNAQMRRALDRAEKKLIHATTRSSKSETAE